MWSSATFGGERCRILLYGCPESPIENVILDDVQLHIKASPLQASYGGNFDLRAVADPRRGIFRHDIPGLYAQYIHGITLRNFRLRWDSDLPEFFTHGIEAQYCKNLEIEGFDGGPAHPGGLTLLMLESENAWVRRSRREEVEIDAHIVSHAELD
jgi:hypothetical protein